jgi:hypothetical protein
MSLNFGIYGLSWTSMKLTCGSVWMTRGSLYIMWPNDKMTRGSLDDSWLYEC